MGRIEKVDDELKILLLLQQFALVDEKIAYGDYV
jgi:hypothetical protein